MEAKIKQRIDELKQERDTLIKNANAQIAAYNGAIAELENLLDAPAEDSPEEE